MARPSHRRGVLIIEPNEPAADAAAPIDPATPGPPERKSVTVPLPSANALLVSLAALLVAGLFAAVVILAIKLHDKAGGTPSALPSLTSSSASLDATSQSAIVAATSYATDLSTYSYLHLSDDFAKTEAHAVAPFLTEYTKETAAIQPNLEKLKSTSTATVKSAGIVSVTPTTAVVDLFVDQSITNSAAPKPRVDPQRMTMSLTRVGTEWKITKVEVL